MAHVTTIKRSDLEKIQSKLKGDSISSQQAELLRLKELSESRAQKWPNTIMANRRRQEEERAQRMEEDEKRKQELERLSALEREQDRQRQIERANKILFEASDRVKGLHSKLILSDVLAEREAQISHKKLIEEIKKEQDREYLTLRNAALEVAEAQELEKFRREKERLLDQQRVQLEQLEELKARILREREEGRKEGDMVRRKALEEAEAQRQAELARIERAKQSAMATKLANEALQEFKRLEKEREHSTELAIEAYSKRREELEVLRRQKEAEKKAEKAAQRERLVRAIEENFSSAQQSEQARLDRDVQEAADKAAEQERERLERRQAEWKDIDASRRAQLAARKDNKKREKEDDAAFAGAWRDRLAELREAEKREAEEKAAKNRHHQAFLMRQVEFKQKRKGNKTEEAAEDELLRKMALNEEDELFKDYAAAVTSDYQTKGRTTAFITHGLGNTKGIQATMR